MASRILDSLHRFMALPALALFGVFFLYPLCRGIGLSLTNWNGYMPARFVGFENFGSFFQDPRAVHDLAVTVGFALGSAPLLILCGLGLALLLDGSGRLRRAARVVVYLPAVISPLIMGYIWYFLLQPGRGFIDRTLGAISPGAALPDWYGNGDVALIVMIAVNVWQYAGLTMVVFSAGLQSIPPELYEAAHMDGADRAQRFWYVTLPMLAESMRVNVVTNIIGSLAVFDIVVALTDGGPGYATESLSLYIMRMSYGNSVGYATSVAVILFAATLVPVALYMRLVRRKGGEA